MTTSFTAFVASAIWGSADDKEKDATKDVDKAERQELAQKLVAKGITETDARKAAEMCPRVSYMGKEYLLLDYMVGFGAKESEAVHALFATNGDAHSVVRFHEKTFLEPRRRLKEKRNNLIKQLVDLGIDEQEAKQTLKSVDWDLEQARSLLLEKLERESKILERSYLAKQETFRKVSAKSKKTTTARRATSGMTKKQSRYSNAVHVSKPKQRKLRKTIVEWSGDEDDEKLDVRLNTISVEEEQETMSTGYHSIAEFDVEMTQGEDDVESKPTAIHSKEQAKTSKPAAIHNKEPARKKASPAIPVAATATLKSTASPAKNPPKSAKMKIFNLRKRIAAPTAKSLVQALLSVYNNNNSPDRAVAEFQSLKDKQEFSAGPPAECLDLLMEFPSLRHAVIIALEGKAKD